VPLKYFAFARVVIFVVVCGANLVNIVALITPQLVVRVSVAGIFFAGTFGCLRVAGTRALAVDFLHEATEVGRSAACAGTDVAANRHTEMAMTRTFLMITPTRLLLAVLM
jgi:hypothetical protein